MRQKLFQSQRAHPLIVDGHWKIILDAMHAFLPIIAGFGIGVSLDFDLSLFEIDDPVLRYFRLGIDALFPTAVVGERRV